MNYSPKQIVQQLDKYIIGQDDAKKAVAIALRNRYRRSQLPAEVREEITPKNNPITIVANRFFIFFEGNLSLLHTYKNTPIVIIVKKIA